MKQKLRYAVLILFLIAFSILSVRHFVLGGQLAASVDALCPFGGFENLITLVTTGDMIPRIMLSSFVLATGVILISVVFARGFCGWICPFGTVQELLGKIRKKKYRLPGEKYFRHLKYPILFVIILLTPMFGYLIFRNFDPFLTFFHFGKGVLWNPEQGHLMPFLITIGTLVGAVFISRFWCKYLCPLGAITALLRRFNITNLRRSNKCTDCKICDKVCPMDIEVSTPEVIDSPECINCNICIDKCPVDALSIETVGKKLKPNHYGIAVVGIFLLIIGVAMASGFWQSLPIIELITDDELDPEDIKGWMSLQQVSDMTGISLIELYDDLELPIEIQPDTPIKQISETYGIEVHASEIKDHVSNKNTTPVQKAQCPWSITDDPYPGKCGLYKDVDSDGMCDYG